MISAAALASVAMGVFSGNGYLVVAALPLGAYLILARLISKPPHRALIVSRSLTRGGAITQREEATCTIRLENHGPDLDVVEVLDKLPPELELRRGSNRNFCSMGEGSRASFTYTFCSDTPGAFDLGPIALSTTDSFGLHQVTWSDPSQVSLRVYPKVEAVRARLRLAKIKSWPGETISRRRGSGLEFRSIREYAPGDPLRKINWRAFGRLDRPFTNEFSAELAGEVVIVLDARQVSSDERSQRTALRYAPSAAATIAYSLLRDRNMVGLMVMGDLLGKVYPGVGRRQLDRILASLSSVQTGNRWNVRQTAHYLKLLFPRIRDVVMVSPMVDEEVYIGMGGLVYEGFNAVLVAPFSDTPGERVPSTRERELAVRLLRLRREVMVSKLRTLAPVLEWDTDQPIGAVLQQRSLEVARAR